MLNYLPCVLHTLRRDPLISVSYSALQNEHQVYIARIPRSSFSCTFATLPKGTTSVVMSVCLSDCPSVRPHETTQKYVYVPSDSEGTYFCLNLTCVILTGRRRPTRRNPRCLLPGLGSNSLNSEETPFCLPLQLSPTCHSGTSVMSVVRYASC